MNYKAKLFSVILKLNSKMFFISLKGLDHLSRQVFKYLLA